MTYEEFENELNKKRLEKDKSISMYFFIAENPNYDPESFDKMFDKTEKEDIDDYSQWVKAHNIFFEEYPNKHSEAWKANYTKICKYIFINPFIISHDNMHIDGKFIHYIGDKSKERILEKFKKCTDDGYNIQFCTVLDKEVCKLN